MKAFVLAELRKEKDPGFTLVELMIALVLSSFVILGGGEMLRQLIVASSHNADETVAIIQVQNTGFWVSQDAVQAQVVNCFDPLTDPQKRILDLTWTEWDGTPLQVTYFMVDMTDELGNNLWQFMRYHSANGETTMISEFLDPAATSCSWDPINGVLDFTLAVKVDNTIQTSTFEVKPRFVN